MRALALAVVLGCGSPAQPDAPRVPPPVPGLGPTETVPPDLQPASACGDAPLVTPEQLAAGEHAGERVAIDLVPHVAAECTLMACFDGNTGRKAECCNQCAGGYAFELTHQLDLALDGLPGCSGMDCNWHCEPFGRQPTRAYRFVGASSYTAPRGPADHARSRLRVERFCAAQ